jgi:hypothetical protein
MLALFHLSHLPVFVLGAAICLTLVVLTALSLRTRPLYRRGGTGVEAERDDNTRACRYCRGGIAVLVEETIRLDGDELINVSCFACNQCGLPQWSVDRKVSSPRVL